MKGSAPACKSSAVLDVWLFHAAADSGVHPKFVAAFRSAPDLINRVSAASYRDLTAKYSGD